MVSKTWPEKNINEGRETLYRNALTMDKSLEMIEQSKLNISEQIQSNKEIISLDDIKNVSQLKKFVDGLKKRIWNEFIGIYF